jgi:hypothetical protein
MFEAIIAEITTVVTKQGYKAFASIFKKRSTVKAFSVAIRQESYCNREIIEKLIKSKETLQRKNLTALLETSNYDKITSARIPIRQIFEKTVEEDEKQKCLEILAKKKCINKSIEKKINSITYENEIVSLLYHKIKMLKKFTESGAPVSPVRYKNILALLVLYIVNNKSKRR